MIVTDSSTLILLTKIGVIDILLKDINEDLVLTPEVYDEVIIKETDDAKIIKQRIKENKILIKEMKNKKLFNNIIKDFNIEIGESSAIALSLENNALLFVDDRKAINACKALNIEFATALSLLRDMYKKKLMSMEEMLGHLRLLWIYGRYSSNEIEKFKEDIK